MKKIKDERIRQSLIIGLTALVGLGIGLVVARPKTIPKLKDGKEVLAKIDGKNFTANDLYAELKKQGGSQILINLIDEYIASKEITDKTDAEAAAKSYLEDLKAQYAQYGGDLQADIKNAGYENEDAFLEVVIKDKMHTLTAEKYIKENMITDKEIKDYWEENIEGDMHVRYILITPEVKDDMSDEEKTEAEAKALAEANEVIAALKKGENFADLANEHSDDSSTASEGGLFDGFSKNDVVEEFWNAAVNLKDGKYTTTPVESSYGYFVIYRIKQDKKPSIEDKKEEILTALLNEKEKTDEDSNNVPDIVEEAWVKIRKSYNLDIIDSEVKEAYNKSIK